MRPQAQAHAHSRLEKLKIEYSQQVSALQEQVSRLTAQVSWTSPWWLLLLRATASLRAANGAQLSLHHAQVSSASEVGDGLYVQLDQQRQQVQAVLSSRDASSFSVHEQLQLKDSRLKSKEAEVQSLQQKLSHQSSMMGALEGAHALVLSARRISVVLQAAQRSGQ